MMRKRRIRKALIKVTGGKCFYCGKRVALKRKGTTERMTIDHITPKAKGGKDGKANLVACCFECNQEKGNKMPEDFYVRVNK